MKLNEKYLPYASFEAYLSVSFHQTFKFFSSLFDADHEELPLQLQMELNELWCLENLKSKFLNKNHLLLSGRFYKHIIHTQILDLDSPGIQAGWVILSWISGSKGFLLI